MVLQSQFDKQGFRFLVSQMVIYIFHPVLSVVQRRRFPQPSHDNRDGGLLQRFSFITTFKSCLKTGKGILLSCKPVRRECKVRSFGWPLLTISKSYKHFAKFLISQFFSQQFSSLGEQVWRSESIRLPLSWPGIESRIPNSTQSICQHSHMVSYEALRLNSKIVLFRTLP